MPKIEKDFAGLMESLPSFKPSPVTAVAVSGGADSLALTFLAHKWASDSNRRIIALTVDHGLREGSANEAKQVAEWLKHAGIEHYILTYEGKKPTSSIPDEARKIRYGLLTQWCRSHNTLHLLIAHHIEDQAETFLMRLERGSGVDGLSAMTSISNKNGIQILRPLLQIHKNTLKEYLKERNQKWIEDPTNQDTSFARNKLRKLMSTEDELLIKRLCTTAKTMSRVRNALEFFTMMCMKDCLTLDPAGFCTIELRKFLSFPEEIALRVLAATLTAIGGKIYPPRFEKLQNLFAAIITDPTLQGGRTLYGCKIFNAQKNTLIICREAAAIEGDVTIKPGVPIIWDNRFYITLNKKVFSHPLTIGTIKNYDVVENMNHLHKEVINTIPCLKDDKILSIPHINFYSEQKYADAIICKFNPKRPLNMGLL